MLTQLKRAHLLKNLHIKGDPLILFNIWDAGSAIAIQESGAKAIATGSWSVAASHGSEDGEQLSFDLVLANLKRIIANVDLQVTIDLEGGYKRNPTEVQEIVRKVIEAGAVGINFEDQDFNSCNMYSIEDQCARIKAIREIADHKSIPLFINARTDIFLKTDSIIHDANHLEESIRRAIAYAEVGANGFFAPGLRNNEYIEKLCRLSPIPVIIMVLDDTFSSRRLSELGVAHISYGPSPYCQVMDTLKESGRRALLMS